MWKKWLAFSGMLALIILLDPTHTPAQPGGGGKGGKGGFGQPRDGGGGGKGSFGQPPGGGGFGQPPGGGGFGQPPGGGGFGQPPGGAGGPGGGFGRTRDGGGGGFGQPPGGGGFGQPPGGGGFGGPGGPGGGGFGQPPGGGGFGGPGGPGGGGMGGGRGAGGSIDPERGWMMVQRLTGSTGDTVDLSKIPPETRNFLKSAAERNGSLVLPESGIWTKAEYTRFHAESEAAKASFAAANGGGMGGGMGFDPRAMEGRGRDRGFGGGFGGEFGGGYGGGYGYGGEFGGRMPFERKETEEERPVAMRYGKLPQGLPGWYDELDVDKDGQVSLYEWRKSKDTKEFTEMDLNNDGLVTADEYLRFARQKNIDTKVEAYVNSEGADRPANWGLGAPLDKGDGKGPTGKFGPGSGAGMWNTKGPNGGTGSETNVKSERPEGKGKDREKGSNPWSKGKN